MEEATTIQVKADTKFCLDSIKLVKQESYDNVIKRLIHATLDLAEQGMDVETTKKIKERLKEVNEGKVVSTKELRNILFGKTGGNELRKGMDRKNKG